MNKYICVGKILKPQALKGEVKISANVRDINSFLTYEYLYLGEEYEKFEVEKCRIQDGFVVVKFKNIDDANTAETLRNQDVFIDNTQLAILPQDEFYVQDLIGINVFSMNSEEYLGEVVAIDNYSSTDIITIKKEDKEILFPFLSSVVIDVDIDKKKMLVDIQKFKEVCVDEN